MDKKELKTLEILKKCYETLSDKKASDIKILKLAEKSSITDYFIIATGTSEPHLRALKKELERNIEDFNVRIDYQPDSGWAVIDGFDFMVHLFIDDKRNFYALEELWKDAEVVDIEKLKN